LTAPLQPSKAGFYCANRTRQPIEFLNSVLLLLAALHPPHGIRDFHCGRFPILLQPQQVIIAADDVIHLRGSRAFEDAIVGRVGYG
jgi:hypothetical protein